MNKKIMDLLNSNRKKIGIALLCSGLILAIGTGGVLAADAHEKMLVKSLNGVTSYSKDDGQSWTKGTPEGFKETVNKDGSSTVTAGIPPKDGERNSLMVRNKNGVMSYSTDDGNTWSDKAPEGVTTSQGEDGSVMVKQQ